MAPIPSAIHLGGDIEIENPLQLVLDFVAAYPRYERPSASAPESFGEADLRLANRGGARISAAEIAAILERRSEIESALRSIHSAASLAHEARTIPWIELTRLFDSFAGIGGVGLSKTTKALHPKRPALIPMLDSVVQAYLTRDNPDALSATSFGELATAFMRGYKGDLDANRRALRGLQLQLGRLGHELTEVRILDVVIWSASTAT
jgi:hypothetical protein